MSDYTQTPNYQLYKPTFDADVDQWGNHWNTNADVIDATLKAVDDKGHGAFLSNVPPAPPFVGQLWWNTDDGNLYVWFDDGTSAQWVLSIPAGATNTVPEAPVDGLTYGRNNGVWIPATEEAPQDTTPYARQDGAWLQLTPIFATFTLKAGDTMSGPLVLPADPTLPLQATTKQYTDANDLLRVLKAGDTMTGPLVLPGPPTLPTQAADKAYVDQAVAASALYQGVWQVAANVPDLRVPPFAPLNGWSWIAQTADPLVPEVIPGGLPGISGQTADSGDRIVWNTGTGTYGLIKGSSLSIQEASALFVDVAGDSMTGLLILSANPTAALGATTKQYTDAADALRVLKAGDSMSGPLVLPAAAPTLPTHATNKSYVDTQDALRVLKAGDTMGGPLLQAADPVNPLGTATKRYVDATVASLNLYQGQWQVALNNPNLNVPPNAPLNGYTWIAQTVDPNVAEVAPAGIPGIGGLTIFNGDTIKWNSGLSQYDHFQGSSLTVAQADGYYVNVVGDAMTGALILAADPVAPLGAAPKQYVDQVRAYVDTVAANYVPLAGGVMTGMLNLPLAPAPTLPQQATTKQYVDQSIAASSLYQGIWNVASNTPNLSVPPATPLNGYSWVAQTVNPNTPEAAPGGLPGVTAGTLIDAGTTIRWNGGSTQYELIRGGSLTAATAGTLFVDVTGDTMSGNLTFNGSNLGVNFPGGSRVYDWTDKPLTLTEGVSGAQPQIRDHNGANARDIIDTINGDARYVNKSGDVMTGSGNLETHELLLRNGGAAGSANPQIRMGYNNQAGATYGHEIRTGHDGGTLANNTMQFWLWGGSSNGASNSSPNTQVLALYGDRIFPNVPFTGLTLTGQININMGANATGVVLNKSTRTNDAAPRILWQNGRGGSGFMASITPTQTGSDIYYSNAQSSLEFRSGQGGYGVHRFMWNNPGSPVPTYFEGDVYAQGVKLTSDAAFKTDIQPVARDEALRAFEALKPKRFRYKTTKIPNPLSPTGWSEGKPNLDARLEWGFVADDIEAVAPHLVIHEERVTRMDADGAELKEPLTEEIRHYDVASVLAILTEKIRDLEERLKQAEARE